MKLIEVSLNTDYNPTRRSAPEYHLVSLRGEYNQGVFVAATVDQYEVNAIYHEIQNLSIRTANGRNPILSQGIPGGTTIFGLWTSEKGCKTNATAWEIDWIEPNQADKVLTSAPSIITTSSNFSPKALHSYNHIPITGVFNTSRETVTYSMPVPLPEHAPHIITLWNCVPYGSRQQKSIIDTLTKMGRADISEITREIANQIRCVVFGAAISTVL